MGAEICTGMHAHQQMHPDTQTHNQCPPIGWGKRDRVPEEKRGKGRSSGGREGEEGEREKEMKREANGRGRRREVG